MVASAKRIRVSSDNGATYHTLPGNSGEFTNEGQQLDDTIFGQLFKSNFPGLINWSVSGSAIYKGFAGYNADLNVYSASTAMTAEATTAVVAGIGGIYQITAAARRVIDRAVAVVVLDTAVAVSAANIEYIDFLFGRVKFVSTYTPSGAITITGAYFATVTQLTGSKDFTLTMTADPIDQTDLVAAQGNSGHRVFSQGLRTVEAEVSGFYSLTNGFRLALVARSEIVLEIKPVGNTEVQFRGVFRYTNQSQSGDVGALEEETVTLSLSVPADAATGVPWYAPFSVGYLSPTLSQAVQICLNAFLDGSIIDARYLPDGTTGLHGDVIVTEMTLNGGLESMNMFDVQLQGTGQVDAVV